MTQAKPPGADVFAHCCAYVLIVLGLCCAASAAEPSPVDPYRQAILIGVWNYEHEEKLGSMESDLTMLSDTFNGMGFDDVQVLPNPRRHEIEEAVSVAVDAAITESPSRSVLTVIYFGGHGTMVGNASYLLARDFSRPTTESEIIVSGAIRADYFARRLKETGQPSLLIVDACRNVFTPATDTAPSSRPLERAPLHATPMIAAPAQHLGYMWLFGQAPGKIVEVPARAQGEASPLVGAISRYAPRFGLVSAMANAVRYRVMTDTANLRHPLEPELVDRGGGVIHLFFDPNDRELDRRRWDDAREHNDAEMVRLFLATFRTSPYAPVAKWWLENHQPAAGGQFASYSRSVRKELGRRTGFFGIFRRRPELIGSDGIVVTGDGDTQAVADIESIRRISERTPVFEARSIDGQVFEVAGDLPEFDPSRLTTFWSDGHISPLACTKEQIEAGDCGIVEHIGSLLVTRATHDVGTMFIAAVIDAANQDEAADELFDRVVTVRSRLSALNVPDGSVAFRNLYRSELPDADATILVKRGDGRPLSH